jgi:hypothetical protein
MVAGGLGNQVPRARRYMGVARCAQSRVGVVAALALLVEAGYNMRLPVKFLPRRSRFARESGSLKNPRRITGSRRGWDDASEAGKRGSFPLTTGWISSMIRGCHGNVTPSKFGAV